MICPSPSVPANDADPNAVVTVAHGPSDPAMTAPKPITAATRFCSIG